MSIQPRTMGIIALIIFFIFAKVWVFKHPKSMVAIVIGAGLLILSESAEAQG